MHRDTAYLCSTFIKLIAMKIEKIYLLLLIFFYSCNAEAPNKLTANDFKALQKDSKVLISDPVQTEKSLLYIIHYDFGGMGTGDNYFYHKKNSDYYYTLNSISLNPRKCEIWHDQIIENAASWSRVEATDTERWVLITSWTNEKGQPTFSADFHESKPAHLKMDNNKISVGSVYYVDSLQISYLGKETDSYDITTMKPGLYLLTAPSIFYKRKINIDDLDSLLK